VITTSQTANVYLNYADRRWWRGKKPQLIIVPEYHRDDQYWVVQQLCKRLGKSYNQTLVGKFTIVFEERKPADFNPRKLVASGTGLPSAVCCICSSAIVDINKSCPSCGNDPATGAAPAFAMTSESHRSLQEEEKSQIFDGD